MRQTASLLWPLRCPAARISYFNFRGKPRKNADKTS